MSKLEKIIRNIVLAGAMVVGPFLSGCSKSDGYVQPPVTIEKYDGFCYGPFRDNENPDNGVYPTVEELREDIQFINKFTRRIRTYGNASSLFQIPTICQENGLKCFAGAWLGRYNIENEQEVNNLLKIADSNIGVEGFIVGNEVLLRKDLSKEDLSNYIKKVNDATDIPVGTAEIWGVLLQNPDIAVNCDILLAHIHPYWEGIPVENAANYVIQKYGEVAAAFPGKEIIIGETGWPSAGNTIGQAVPSESNQRKFFEEFTGLAKQNNIPYFYFEVFDEKWKDKLEGGTGAHWGIFYSNGSLKPQLLNLLPEDVGNGINRPPRELEEVTIDAPVVVYNDGGADDNHFQPSGHMGDLASIFIQRDYKNNPYSGESCIKITYSPTTFDSWAGIYWQYPLNNWGEYPGYDINNASKLTFWARGQNGGEKAEFKAGGIKTPGKPYDDSFGPVTTGVVELFHEWKSYNIDLTNKDLSNVIGGFCWETNRLQNPNGCTIYLDDIKYE